MAAYAALVSLTNVLERIPQRPAWVRIHVDSKQIESLHEKVSFLIEFLEYYSHQITKLGADGLQSQMAATSYAAEDIIETFLTDQILAGFPDNVKQSLRGFSQDLQKVLEQMDLIEAKVDEIKDKMSTVIVKDQQPVDSSHVAALSRIHLSGKTVAVGFDDHLTKLMDKLTGLESKLQMFSIVGMGGIGKTTLARNVYDDSIIIDHFDIRAWVTISQEYTLREILLILLHGTKSSGNVASFTDEMAQKSDQQLEESLYKSLFGKRYLIVIDDIWSINAWHDLRMFFPNNFNGSRIMITTRLSNVAILFSSEYSHKMDLLNEDESWDLFCAKVFPQESCPPELEEIAKKIVKSCKGLPLALVVIGGLLAKSKRTSEYWEDVAENLTSIINSESDEHCSKILSLSYSHLPIHLKPCFLYMATFREDYEIRISKLIKLWVAEGFLKPVKFKSLEEIAEEYLKDLVDRNLVMVGKRETTGKIKSCIMHDLLRDFCLREAEREDFLCVTRVYNTDIPPGIENKRRVCIHSRTNNYVLNNEPLEAWRSASFVRSLVCDSHWVSESVVPNLKLLRLLDVRDHLSPIKMSKLINSRYLSFYSNSRFPSSISVLWNLQSLIVNGDESNILPLEIWLMTQIRHLQIYRVFLPDPSEFADGTQSYSCIMENLQTLATVRNLRLTEEFLKTVPNLKKLKIEYEDPPNNVKMSHYCLNYLVYLHKLETLSVKMVWDCEISAGNIAFPLSLKKLTLSGCRLSWEDISVVGSLPNLEVLKLQDNAFQGPEWNAIEGEFVRLKFLLISWTYLEYWRADENHFPSLEHLVLCCGTLVELPLGLAELPMLRLIQLKGYVDSLLSSAKQILEECENLGNEDLQIQVCPWYGKEYYLTN